MNSIKWKGDETLDDIYDHWIQLLENGNRAGLLKEIYCAVNGHGSAFEEVDGELVYRGPDMNCDDMTILEFAYGSDVRRVREMIEESDEYELGENLK